MSQITITPDLLYQVVASNPNLKELVNRTVQFMQTQQQLAPQLQQMMQNPISTLNNLVNWQHENAAIAPTPSATPQPQTQPQPTQQGGNSQMGIQEQAMAIVDEFRKYFNAMNENFIILNNNLKELHGEITELKNSANLTETKPENVSKSKVKE